MKFWKHKFIKLTSAGCNREWRFLFSNVQSCQTCRQSNSKVSKISYKVEGKSRDIKNENKRQQILLDISNATVPVLKRNIRHPCHLHLFHWYYFFFSRLNQIYANLIWWRKRTVNLQNWTCQLLNKTDHPDHRP